MEAARCGAATKIQSMQRGRSVRNRYATVVGQEDNVSQIRPLGVCVCARERQRERENVSQIRPSGMCVCVLERERERERMCPKSVPL
jgi:hypothetical protein